MHSSDNNSVAAAVPFTARPWLLPLLGFALVWPTLMTWLYFIVLAGPVSAERPANEPMQIAYALGKAVQFTWPILCLWLVAGRWPRWRKPSWRGLELGLGFGVLAFAVIVGLYFGFLRNSEIFQDVPTLLRAKLCDFGLATPPGFILLAGFLSLIHSFLEEYYWRWFVFAWLWRWWSYWPALVISSLGFMAHHVIVLGVYFPDDFWTVAAPFSLCIAAGGAVWAWLYARTETIYPAWISHALVDVALMVVGYNLMFG
ncbi:MAG: CPBP family intramembrane glutamic endopeptidase [Gemmataceae bacterium]